MLPELRARQSEPAARIVPPVLLHSRRSREVRTNRSLRRVRRERPRGSASEAPQGAEVGGGMTGFIVLYDDDQGLCVPFGRDPSCFGAIQVIGESEPVVVFPDKATAQNAVRISRAWSRVLELQGAPRNTEFEPPSSKHIRIVPVTGPEVTA